MIFAAGVGSRLRPLTDTLPKALVPVAGQPLLQIVLDRLAVAGFENIVVNVHHHATQIEDYLRGSSVKISREEQLLDTGGGLRQAMPLFANSAPILAHNVDILSNAALAAFYDTFSAAADDVWLLVSSRPTTRHLLFDNDMRLVGWRNETTKEVRSPYPSLDSTPCRQYAFAGIHCLQQRVAPLMAAYPAAFSIVDFYVAQCRNLRIKGVVQDGVSVLDVGKKDSLLRAEQFLAQQQNNISTTHAKPQLA